MFVTPEEQRIDKAISDLKDDTRKNVGVRLDHVDKSHGKMQCNSFASPAYFQRHPGYDCRP
jgi:hypothetical protein